MQAKKTRQYYSPLKMAEMKGLYEGVAKINIFGDPLKYFIRKNVKILDNCMFTTALVNIALLDTYRLANGPKPSDKQMKTSLEAISEFHDKNYNFKSSIMSFWPQTFNTDTGFWEQSPENELAIFKLATYLPLSGIGALLDGVGKDEAAHDVSVLSDIRFVCI